MDQQTVAARPTGQPRPQRRGWPVFTVVAVGIVVFLLGGFGGSYQGKLSEVQRNDNAAFLPGSAESTQAGAEADLFVPVRDLPGFVVFQRDSGLTEQDRADIVAAQAAVAKVPGVDAAAVLPPQFSADNTTASLFVPLIAKQDGVADRRRRTLHDRTGRHRRGPRGGRRRTRGSRCIRPAPARCWWRSSARSRVSTARCCSRPSASWC